MTIATRFRVPAERVALTISNEDQRDQDRRAKIDRLQELVTQGLESGQPKLEMTSIRDVAKTCLDAANSCESES